MTMVDREQTERDAFKAGWRTNAIPGSDLNDDCPAYLDQCEERDWLEYKQLGLPGYLDSFATAEDVAQAIHTSYEAGESDLRRTGDDDGQSPPTWPTPGHDPSSNYSKKRASMLAGVQASNNLLVKLGLSRQSFVTSEVIKPGDMVCRDKITGHIRKATAADQGAHVFAMPAFKWSDDKVGVVEIDPALFEHPARVTSGYMQVAPSPAPPDTAFRDYTWNKSPDSQILGIPDDELQAGSVVRPLTPIQRAD